MIKLAPQIFQWTVKLLDARLNIEKQVGDATAPDNESASLLQRFVSIPGDDFDAEHGLHTDDIRVHNTSDLSAVLMVDP